MTKRTQTEHGVELELNQHSDPVKAREGYRAALAMVGYEGQLVWRVFPSLLAANAFLVALATASTEIKKDAVWLPRLVPILRLLICLAWWLITMRQFCYYAYWFRCARQCERVGIAPASSMVTDGARLAQGESVTVDGAPFRMNWGSRLFRIQWLVHTVILSFIIIYCALLFEVS